MDYDQASDMRKEIGVLGNGAGGAASGTKSTTEGDWFLFALTNLSVFDWWFSYRSTPC
jgi:hypothetical protein